jgi:hypothetical protein
LMPFDSLRCSFIRFPKPVRGANESEDLEDEDNEWSSDADYDPYRAEGRLAQRTLSNLQLSVDTTNLDRKFICLAHYHPAALLGIENEGWRRPTFIPYRLGLLMKLSKDDFVDPNMPTAGFFFVPSLSLEERRLEVEAREQYAEVGAENPSRSIFLPASSDAPGSVRSPSRPSSTASTSNTTSVTDGSSSSSRPSSSSSGLPAGSVVAQPWDHLLIPSNNSRFQETLERKPAALALELDFLTQERDALRESFEEMTHKMENLQATQQNLKATQFVGLTRKNIVSAEWHAANPWAAGEMFGLPVTSWSELLVFVGVCWPAIDQSSLAMRGVGIMTTFETLLLALLCLTEAVATHLLMSIYGFKSQAYIDRLVMRIVPHIGVVGRALIDVDFDQQFLDRARPAAFRKLAEEYRSNCDGLVDGKVWPIMVGKCLKTLICHLSSSSLLCSTTFVPRTIPVTIK